MPPLRFGAAASLGLAHRRRLEAAHLSRSRRPDVHPVRVTLLARDLPQNELLEGHDCDLPIAAEAVNMGWTWRWPQTAATRCPYTGHEDLLAVLRMAHRHRSSRVVLAGCGSSSGSSSSAASVPATTGGSTTMASGGSGTSVGVTLKDFSITLAGGDSLLPGTYTFTVANQGPSAHNLTIEGPGVDNQATPTFGSGETKTLTVTLKDGKYDFFCSVPGHKQAGMNV